MFETNCTADQTLYGKMVIKYTLYFIYVISLNTMSVLYRIIMQ